MEHLQTSDDRNKGKQRKQGSWQGRRIYLLRIFVLLPLVVLMTFLTSIERPAAEPEKLKIEGVKDFVPEKCYRMALKEVYRQEVINAQLGWTMSGVWDGGSLLLTDTAFGRLARVPIPGVVGEGVRSLRDAHEDSEYRIDVPFYASPRRAGGYLLLDQGTKGRPVLFVNGAGVIENSIPTFERELRDDSGARVNLTAVFRMVPLGNGILAYADFQDPSIPDEEGRREEKYWSSFAYIDAFRQGYVPIGERISYKPNALKEYYLRDLSYLASDGESEGYILNMTPNPSITKVVYDEGGVKETRLEHFPERLTCPDFQRGKEDYGTPSRNTRWVFNLYKMIEDNRMPVGLMHWRDRLFVVAKEAKDRLDTAWRLIEISPDDGRTVGDEIKLPSWASHITLVPGAEHIGVIEKGPVGVAGKYPNRAVFRPTLSTLLFRGEWLDHQGKGDGKPGTCEELLVDTELSGP